MNTSNQASSAPARLSVTRVAAPAAIGAVLSLQNTALGAMLVLAPPATPEGQATDAWSSAGSYAAGQTIAAQVLLPRSARLERITVWGASSGWTTPGLDNVSAVEVLLWNADFSRIVLGRTFGVQDLEADPTGEVTKAGSVQYQISGTVDALLPAGTYHLNVGAVLVDGGSDPFNWSTSADGSLWINTFDKTGWSENSAVATPAFALEGTVLMADLNGDGAIDGADVGLLLGGWGLCAECARCLADLNGDCVVDGADLGMLLGEWQP
jgi:hypothetical protein